MNTDKFLEELEEKIQYKFKDKKILKLAMTHSSYANEHNGTKLDNNERLEFLGDAVLELVTSDFLFRNFDYPEGVMFSIALMNMLNPLIDSCIKGTTFVGNGKKWAVIAAFFVGSIGLNVGFNALYPLNATTEESKEDPNKWLENYTIASVGDGIYTVRGQGFYGNVELKVYVDTANQLITKVEVVSANDHERITEEGISLLIGDNLNLSFNEFDNFTCSDGICSKTGSGETSFDVKVGSSYSSSAVIGNLKAVVETVRGGAK
jgi:uncharacterized protein with FMN-binding domain